jgi:hypothetical protein
MVGGEAVEERRKFVLVQRAENEVKLGRGWISQEGKRGRKGNV